MTDQSDGEFVNFHETIGAMVDSLVNLARQDYEVERSSARAVPPSELLGREMLYLLADLDAHQLASIAYDATEVLSCELLGGPRIEFTGENFLIHYGLLEQREAR